jgi:tRNA nucleotidyltransferase/poly(A) polymerase
MADYIYLLENRLSADQQNALRQLREVAREAGFLVFLTGDSVRDLTSGHAVRDLEVAVHGNALKLKKTIEKVGGKIWGEDEPSKSLFVCFPGTVRVDIISCHSVEYPKPGKAVNHPATILDDLRRRDFTVNAMAISLNEGSFGLLMDPLNGVADIETRSLRLVSNYGFLEEPSLLIRATRYQVRLGWELDPKTRTRYENAVGENVIEHLSDTARSQELEQIGHEEEGLKVLQALETAGWMKVLFPAWTSAKADAEKLTGLHDLAVELLVQGIHPDISAAQMQLLTAKLAPKDLSALKKLMLRPGFVEEWNSLDSLAAKFAKILLSKENATPSAGFKLFTSYDPEAILWLGFTTRDPAVKERFNQFLRVWPEAKQRIPNALMQEMRITPEIAIYKDVIHQIFLQLIDGKLETPEEMRAFLEPHSPPAPPPQVTLKRPRAKRGEAKLKERSFDDDEEAEDALEEDEDLDDLGGDEDEIDLGLAIPKADLEPEIGEDLESDSAEDDLDEDEAEPEAEPSKRSSKSAKSAAAPAKGKAGPAGKQVPPSKANAGPTAVPANPSAPAAGKAGKAPLSRKDEKMANEEGELTPGVKPPQTSAAPTSGTTTVLAPGVKPPQGLGAQEMMRPTGENAPGFKPPQVQARTLTAKPAAAAVPQVKQAVKAKSVKAKPVVKAKAVVAKPIKPKLKAKVAPVKKKPASKPAPKPVKKVAPKAKGKKPAVKKGRKR